MDHLYVYQTVFESHEARQVSLQYVLFDQLLEVNGQAEFLPINKKLSKIPHFLYKHSWCFRRQHLAVSKVVQQVSVPLDRILSVYDSALLSIFLN